MERYSRSKSINKNRDYTYTILPVRKSGKILYKYGDYDRKGITTVSKKPEVNVGNRHWEKVTTVDHKSVTRQKATITVNQDHPFYTVKAMSIEMKIIFRNGLVAVLITAMALTLTAPAVFAGDQSDSCIVTTAGQLYDAMENNSIKKITIPKETTIKLWKAIRIKSNKTIYAVGAEYLCVQLYHKRCERYLCLLGFV